MKYKLYALILCSLTYTCFGRYYSPKTTTLAAEQGYPNLIIDLRNKAQEFLTKKRVRTLVTLEDLYKRDLTYRAEKLFEQSIENYFDLEDTIDLTFEEINRTFLQNASELDRKRASIKEKSEYIAQAKEYAQRKLQQELSSYEIFNKNK